MKNSFALVIEDDPRSANIAAKALEAAGFEAEIVEDGHKALERLAVITPAIIVLDLHLPYASGQEILAKIQAEARLAETRIILTTADLFRAEDLREAVDVVLIKPIGFNQLRDLARRLWPLDPAG